MELNEEEKVCVQVCLQESVCVCVGTFVLHVSRHHLCREGVMEGNEPSPDPECFAGEVEILWRRIVHLISAPN